MMKRLFTAAVVFAVFGAIYNIKAEPAIAQKKSTIVWQYGNFNDLDTGSKSFFSFRTKSDKKLSGTTLEEFLKAYTGTDFVGKATYADVLDTLGADGWELIQVVNVRSSLGPENTYYFKRVAN